MKILVISHEYPPVGGGGAQVVQDLCKGLVSNGHHINVITAHYGDLPLIEKHNALSIHRIPSARKEAFRADLKTMTIFVWKSIREGYRLIRSWQPDLIHAHFAVPAGASAFALSWLTRVPYILTAHGGDVPGGAPEKTNRWFRVVRPFSRIIWKQAAGIAAVSPETRQLALDHYPVDITVIPNGIDLNEYQPGNYDPQEPPTIIYSGRFSSEKNAVMVPKTLSGLTRFAWRCVMLGDGLQMGEVKSEIENHHLCDRFILPGWVAPDDVKKWMAESDILFLPSLREGMPIAGLQGLAMGLAMVLSKIGSCPHLVEEGKNGYLADPGNITGYKNGLASLLEDPHLLGKCRQKSRDLAHNFSLENSIKAYENFYRRVVGQSP